MSSWRCRDEMQAGMELDEGAGWSLVFRDGPRKGDERERCRASGEDSEAALLCTRLGEQHRGLALGRGLARERERQC
jgi:hypothetical protein